MGSCTGRGSPALPVEREGGGGMEVYREGGKEGGRERVLHVVTCSAAVTTHSLWTGCCRRSGFTSCCQGGNGGPV